MARFDKLEFDQPREEPARGEAAPRIDKDEKYWTRMADENRRTGHYENALRFYSRALEVDRTLVPAWVGQVQMLILLQEYPQAGLWSRKALEIYPSNGDLLAGQAQSECRMGNLKNAYTLSDAALRQRGESAYRWQVRGEIVVAGKKTKDRHCFDKAQVADSDWLVPLESALIYIHYAVWSMGQQRAQMAVEKAPNAYYAWYVQGLCQSKLGFDSSAIASFNRCLDLCPRHAEAMSGIAELDRPRMNLLRRLGRFFGH